MNKTKFLGLLLLVVSLMTSCQLDEICERGEGERVVRTLILPPFSKINLDISADVFLEQGETQKVTVDAQENIIDLLELDVRGDTWNINFDKICVGNHEKIEIFITMPIIEGIKIDGSGDVLGENTFVTNDIDLEISGSGDMDVALDASFVETIIRGSGSATLQGSSEEVIYRVKGSGDINAFDLTCARADVEVDGSGNINLTVLDFLKARINGSGDITYRGNPELDERVNGSGSIRRD